LKGNIIMASEKLFTVAGTATNPDGTTKARFANDLVSRVKILTKNNCTNINLVELPQPMTKLEALRHLQQLGITEGDAGFAVSNKLAEKAKLAKKGEVKVQAKPSMEAIKARAKAAQEEPSQA
jgi:hypothetical protein